MLSLLFILSDPFGFSNSCDTTWAMTSAAYSVPAKFNSSDSSGNTSRYFLDNASKYPAEELQVARKPVVVDLNASHDVPQQVASLDNLPHVEDKKKTHDGYEDVEEVAHAVNVALFGMLAQALVLMSPGKLVDGEVKFRSWKIPSPNPCWQHVLMKWFAATPTVTAHAEPLRAIGKTYVEAVEVLDYLRKTLCHSNLFEDFWQVPPRLSLVFIAISRSAFGRFVRKLVLLNYPDGALSM